MATADLKIQEICAELQKHAVRMAKLDEDVTSLQLGHGSTDQQVKDQENKIGDLYAKHSGLIQQLNAEVSQLQQHLSNVELTVRNLPTSAGSKKKRFLSLKRYDGTKIEDFDDWEFAASGSLESHNPIYGPVLKLLGSMMQEVDATFPDQVAQMSGMILQDAHALDDELYDFLRLKLEGAALQSVKANSHKIHYRSALTWQRIWRMARGRNAHRRRLWRRQ